MQDEPVSLTICAECLAPDLRSSEDLEAVRQGFFKLEVSPIDNEMNPDDNQLTLTFFAK